MKTLLLYIKRGLVFLLEGDIHLCNGLISLLNKYIPEDSAPPSTPEVPK